MLSENWQLSKPDDNVYLTEACNRSFVDRAKPGKLALKT